MELVAETSFRLAAPVMSPDDPSTVYCLCKSSGAIVAVDVSGGGGGGGSCTAVAQTEGQPAGLAIDRSAAKGPGPIRFIAADPSRQAVVGLGAGAPSEGDVSAAADAAVEIVRAFEGRPLLGPSSVAVDASTGEFFFTDAGLPGDSTLAAPVGGVYRTVNGRQQLLQLARPSLACPSAVALDHGCRVVYVAEMCANRILRYVQQPEGYYHGSVFAQLNGSMGPVALGVHPTTHDVYVATYDLDFVADSGAVHVFEASGELKGTIAVRGPQVTGIAFAADAGFLYITVEGAAGSGAPSALYRTPVAAGDASDEEE